MAEAFIGYSVHVELANGSSLEGTVSHIDSHTQLLTLKNGLYFMLLIIVSILNIFSLYHLY